MGGYGGSEDQSCKHQTYQPFALYTRLGLKAAWHRSQLETFEVFLFLREGRLGKGELSKTGENQPWRAISRSMAAMVIREGGIWRRITDAVAVIDGTIVAAMSDPSSRGLGAERWTA